MTLHPVQLLAPFLFLTLPAMTMVASTAILFESVRWLRGGLGNAVYFVLCIGMFSVMGVRPNEGATATSAFNDLSGLGAVVPSLAASCEAKFPGCTGKTFTFSVGLSSRGNQPWELLTFPWPDVRWTTAIVLARLMWVGLALALALFAAIFFHRFDPAWETPRRASKPAIKATIEPHTATHTILFKFPSLGGQFLFADLVAAELRIALKGVTFWWYAVAGVLSSAAR